MALLDDVLARHSATDKAAILDVARAYDLDDDDPAFVLLLATGALERLLEQHPTKIQETLQSISKSELDQRVQFLRAVQDLIASQQQIQAQTDQSIQSVKAIAQDAVRSETAKQAQYLSRGIETGITSGYVKRVRGLIPVIVAVTVLVMGLGLSTGIMIGRSIPNNQLESRK